MTPLPAAHRRTTTASAALLLLALAGCASGSAAGSPATTAGTPAASSSPSASFSPVTLDNCGTKVTVTTPPQRVVTIKSTSTEMLLALGLQDVIVGTAFADGPAPAKYAEAAAAIPVLSDKVPGQESLLTSRPDFVYGGWESNFSPDGAGDRASLAALQIGTYVSPAACKEPGYQPDLFAAYGWGSGRLFAKAAQDAGPKLTRAGLLAALKKIDDWNGYGLFPSAGPASKRPATCFIFEQVKGGKFVRWNSPPPGFQCVGHFLRR